MHPLLTAAPSNPQAAARATACHLWPRMTRVRGPWVGWLEELAGPLGFVALAGELSRSAPSRLEAHHGLERLERELREAGQGMPESLLGGALAWALEGRGLELAALEAVLEARRREIALATFGTHEELAEHARRLGAARPLSILRASGLASQRRSILAEAGGACGALLEELADPAGALAAGRLVFPAEELARLRLTPAMLGPHGPPDALEVLVHEVLELPRAELRKAWGLVADLGPWRGRIAAGWLRSQWIQLQRLRRAGADLFRAPRRSMRPQRVLGWATALGPTAPPSGLGAWPPPRAR